MITIMLLTYVSEWLRRCCVMLWLWCVSTEPYDFSSWCLILLFSVHASGAALFLVEWLSPNGLDQGMKPIRGMLCSRSS